MANPSDPRSSDSAPGAGPDDPLRRSRTSAAWIAVAALGVVLILLVIFIAQNTETTEIHFFGWSGSVPLAVAMLISAIAGLFLALIGGTLRILQLRRRVGVLKKETQAR